MVLRELQFPISGHEDMVELGASMVATVTGPSKFTFNQRKLSELKILNDAPKPAHHLNIDVEIVLLVCSCNQVEVTSN